MRVAYYLFRKSVTSFDQVWMSGHTPGSKGYTRVALKRTVPFDAEAYLQANKPSSPSWLSYVEPYLDIPTRSRPLNHSSSFLLLLKVNRRVCAVVFGHAFSAINRALLESDFGLKVTLNAVNPEKFRSLQVRNIDPTTVSKQLVVNQDSSLAVFDVDFYHDLISKTEGVPESSSFGKRVGGSDACYLSSDAIFTDVAKTCAELQSLYASKRYTKYFSFVDHVRPVRDDTVIAELDEEFAKALKAGDTQDLSFALPDISGYDPSVRCVSTHP